MTPEEIQGGIMVGGAGHDVKRDGGMVAGFQGTKIFSKALEKRLFTHRRGGKCSFGAGPAEPRALSSGNDEGGNLSVPQQRDTSLAGPGVKILRGGIGRLIR